MRTMSHQIETINKKKKNCINIKEQTKNPRVENEGQRDSTEDLNWQKKGPMNLKSGHLQLSNLGNIQRKE